ncbi:MAG TPA: hypothetical protein DIT32_02955 [Peptococcaceae bacterium]|nr:hypothetical protein [Peptococcaceae bacterium]
MKKMLSGLVILSLLLVSFGPLTLFASIDKPESFSSFENGSSPFAHDEIIVKFRNDAVPFHVIKVPEGKVKEKVREYARRSDIVYAEPNYYAQAFYTPNDSLYSYQWNFGTMESAGIEMEKAWDLSTGASRIVVAIIDTGIAYENYLNYALAPDLSGTVFVEGYDYVNNDSHPNDDNSHGTHVAGTVAQRTNNSLGTAGIAFDTALMPVKVLDKKGSGTYANIANGIRYAADHGAQIINMSLGGSVPSATLEGALAYAYSKGVTIIAAAGNDGTNHVSYPAAYNDYVIAVGATRYDGTRAYYSNYGAGLDLVAPGGDINVDQNGDGIGDGILQNTFDPNTKNPKVFGYWLFQGTSMAAPHVAGVAALLMAHGNATTPDEIRTALQETARDLGNTEGWEADYGWGLVNAYAALQWQGEPNEAPVAEPQSLSMSQDTSLPITLTATDPDGDTLDYAIVSNPSHGILTGTAPNLVYTPQAGYTGEDRFTFIAKDGTLDSNLAAVDITILAVPTAPTIQVDLKVTYGGSRTVKKNTYVWANATVTVEGTVSATVEGHWSGASSDVDSGTTSEGIVSFDSNEVKKTKNPLIFTFEVDKITIDNTTYTPVGVTTASYTFN